MYLLIILLGVYVIVRQFVWTEVFRAVPTVSGESLRYMTLFLTGLLTSVHCIAMCGGLNLAQSMGTENTHPIRGSLLYNLGRLTSYTLTGVTLPWAGSGSKSAVVTATVYGGVRRVTTTLHAKGYDDIQVTAVTTVIWTIIVGTRNS